MDKAAPRSSGRLTRVSSDVVRHFSRDVWAEEAQQAKGWRRPLYAASRFCFLTGRGFVRNQALIRAAALTFTTVLSIVPLLAVAFAISKGLGLQNTAFIRDFLQEIAAGRPEVADRILQYITGTNAKALGWAGVATLFVTLFTTIGTVEKAFNAVWGVPKGRNAWRKFTDFFSITLICPIILFVAGSITVSLQRPKVLHELLGVDVLESAVIVATPYLLLWAAFTFVYVFMPNTKVRIGPAAVAGVLAGTMWQAAQWAYVNWQIGVQKYNAIYGGFAQLPLFLVWLYISWAIVLLGAEMSFAAQHLNAFERERLSPTASAAEKQRLAVLLLTLLADRFHRGLPLPGLQDLADALLAPIRLVAELFSVLTEAGLTVKVEGGEVWTLARGPAAIRLSDILCAVENHGGAESRGALSASLRFVDELLGELARCLRDNPANLTLAEMVERLNAEEAAEVRAGVGG